jgi:hypothetical protein
MDLATCRQTIAALRAIWPRLSGTIPAMAPPESDGPRFPVEAVIEEHREVCLLLMEAVDMMRRTQRLFDLNDGHILIAKCREIERWLDSHQSEV